MPNKMERFTQRARRVMTLAQEEAERMQHNYIGTEHLLLGLMREEGGLAARVLRDLKLYPPRVEELVEQMTRAEQLKSGEKLALAPGAKKVLELAVDEARRMGHHYIGTEHLLLGLVRQSDGIAIDVLTRLNISPEDVRRQIRRRMQESPVQGRARAPRVAERTEEAALWDMGTPGSPKMERFTLHTVHVLSLAEEEAQRAGHTIIGLEHVLIGLMRNEHGNAFQVLHDKGAVTLDNVNLLLDQVSTAPSEAEHLDLDANVKEALERATNEASVLNQRYIGTEHLLLAITTQDRGIALLNYLGLDPQEIRHLTFQALHLTPTASYYQRLAQTSADNLLADTTVLRQPEPQRFAGEWRITLAVARAIAVQMKSNTLNPEHLLVALLIDEGDRTGKLLRAAGLHLERTMAAIRAAHEVAAEPVIEVEMAPKTIELLGLATAASLKGKNYYLQVEHLLIGLLQQKDSAALDVLNQQNVSLDDLEKKARESNA